MLTKPFDGDGARARADIPQQLTRPWLQERQGCGANLSLGDLAIVAIKLVGDAGAKRHRTGFRTRDAFDGDSV